MQQRKRRNFRVGLALLASLGCSGELWAQQPASNNAPSLPDTRVEAAPQADAPATTPALPDTNVQGDSPAARSSGGNRAPNSPFNENFGASNDPVMQGSRFSSPIVDGYLGSNSSTSGSIIALPDADNPATVNVITQEVMRDQQVLRLSDVIRNAGGISQGGDSLFADRLFLRGIELQARDFRKDGFLDPTFVPRDFQNVERVEVLKGPPSVLYGSSSPAGLVNLITKKPLEARFVDTNVTLGSFDQQRYTIDANGYGTSSGNVLYRVNFAHEDSDTFVNQSFLSRTLAAPSVTFKLGDDARLTYTAEYHNDHRRG